MAGASTLATPPAISWDGGDPEQAGHSRSPTYSSQDVSDDEVAHLSNSGKIEAKVVSYACVQAQKLRGKQPLGGYTTQAW